MMRVTHNDPAQEAALNYTLGDTLMRAAGNSPTQYRITDETEFPNGVPAWEVRNITPEGKLGARRFVAKGAIAEFYTHSQPNG